jgi:flagellin-like protein
MKANRKFVQADDAVSPVIAVILMVAITVVLAATVFVLVSDIGGNTANSAPSISWTSDEGQDKLVVSTAAQNADWNRLTVQVDSCTGAAAGKFGYIGGPNTATHVSKPATAASKTALNSGAAAVNCANAVAEKATGSGVGGGAAQKILAGDFVQFCTDNLTPITNVKVTIKDTTANAVVETYTFTDVAVCA